VLFCAYRDEGANRKSTLRTAPIAAGLLAAGTPDAQTATAQDGAALAQKRGCIGCHAVDTKKVGPPLKHAAARFKGKSNAEAAAAIKGSTTHANVKASDEDLPAMNAWMQSGFNRAAGM
jgi:cytochrome c551/c552